MNLPKAEIAQIVEDVLAKLDQTTPRVKRQLLVEYVRRAVTSETILVGYRQWLTGETDRLQAEINAAIESQDSAAIKPAVLASRLRSLETLDTLTKQGGLT